jgi:hypothetical protein
VGSTTPTGLGLIGTTIKETTVFHDPDYEDSGNYDPDVEEDADLEALVLDSVVPAVCIHGCEVEPDGACPHGMPSVLIALGVL